MALVVPVPVVSQDAEVVSDPQDLTLIFRMINEVETPIRPALLAALPELPHLKSEDEEVALVHERVVQAGRMEAHPQDSLSACVEVGEWSGQSGSS